MNKDYGHDWETYPNVATIVFQHVDIDARWIFEISDRINQSAELYTFLRTLEYHKARMVGYNSLFFDYVITHEFITLFERHGVVYASQLYAKADSVINSGDRFGGVWESDHRIPQLDLYKIHHFDNKAKATGLKALEFAMRSASVDDLPFPPGTHLTPEQIPVLIKYNAHDVSETIKFYHYSKEKIVFREKLSERYGVNWLNANDTKIGKEFFIMKLEEAIPGVCYDRSSGRKIKRQTPRESINIGEIILPFVQFEHPELNRVLNYLRQTTITTTLRPPELDKLNATINGFQFDFGAGGLHGSISGRIVRSDDTHVIIDADVESYYPSVPIAHRFFPEHLTEKFCDIYADLKAERKQWPKKTPENEMFKLALNGVYGESNSVWGPFLDPRYTMQVTINGQLSLAMLSEMVIKHCDAEMIQANTDGITVRIPRDKQAQYDQVCAWWQGVTGLTLEFAEYRAMFIRDVNSYIAQTVEGKIKRIGAYAYVTPVDDPATREVQWHKDHSALVVPKAAEAFLVHGTPVADFVHGHRDAFDFMLRTKAPRGSRLTATDGRELPNTIRYHIATSGPYLVKEMPPTAKMLAEGKEDDRRISINKGWPVNVCNHVSEWRGDLLNYQFYIEEANKLVDLK